MGKSIMQITILCWELDTLDTISRTIHHPYRTIYAQVWCHPMQLSLLGHIKCRQSFAPIISINIAHM